MQRLIKLNKNNDVVYNAEIENFHDPENIYLPVKDNYQILVKKDEIILKDQIILENNLNKILSSVSGIVSGLCEKKVNGQKINALVIKNNYEEKSKNIKKVINDKFSKEKIISVLYEFYFKYIASILETKKINNLIINGLEDEPYICNNPYILKHYSKEILEFCDILTETFNIEKTLITIKSNDSDNVNHYLSVIGTYPSINISLVDDKYLIAKPFFLLKYLNLKEDDSLIIDAKMAFDMYLALKYHSHVSETFITLCNLLTKDVKVVKVKIGSCYREVVNRFYPDTLDDYCYILGGLMSGFECNIDEEIITNTSVGLIIMPKGEEVIENCNNCGLCYKICPVKVNPKKVMDTNIKNDKCLDCGLCSYICPSHINLRKFLKGEK